MKLGGAAHTAAAVVPGIAAAGGGGGGRKTVSFGDDPRKKIRKPYTITKSRESWSEQEHDKFLEALQLFDRDWKKIEAFVGSKNVIQIRSHAQKYFLKVQKTGTSEHVPPPRPKRKAAHPYPHKAPKTVAVVSQVGGPFQFSSASLEPGYVFTPDASNAVVTGCVPSWNYNLVPPGSTSEVAKDEEGLYAQMVPNTGCFSRSNKGIPGAWTTAELTDRGSKRKPIRVTPDFSQVYSFIGSLFDPNAAGHLQRLKQMDPINLETILLLMRNLSMNLASPEFEDHKRMLSSLSANAEKGQVAWV